MSIAKRVLWGGLIFGLAGPFIAGILVTVTLSSSAVSNSNDVLDTLASFPRAALGTLLFAYFLGLVPATLTGMIVAVLPSLRLGVHLLVTTLAGMLLSFMFGTLAFPNSSAGPMCAMLSIPPSLLLGWLWHRRMRHNDGASPS